VHLTTRLFDVHTIHTHLRIQRDSDITESRNVDGTTLHRHPDTIFGENSCMNMLSKNLSQCQQLKTVEIILCGHDYENDCK
jgi:hypothetical protein